METKKNLLGLIRKMQTFVSVVIFFFVFVFCWHVTGFEITEIQLSEWGGESGGIGTLWNSIVMLLSVSIFVNSLLYIRGNNRIKHKNISYLLFGFISVCLFLVGAFNLNYLIIHNVSAWLYFFAYPLVIFTFTHIHRKYLQYSDWVKDISISVSMIILPLIFIWLFNGMALAETVHIILVIIWNLKIAFR